MSVILAEIVRHHVEEAAFLHSARAALCRAPHITLGLLARHDERLEAHLDGIVTAGDAALQMCDDAGASFPDDGVFAAAVSAIRRKDSQRLHAIVGAAQDRPSALSALVAAVTWVAREDLQGTVVSFLRADDSPSRAVGLAACAVHGVDPGLARFFADGSGIVRAWAHRAAGELGRRELDWACTAAIDEEDLDSAWWAAWSAVLLGNRGRALDVVRQTSVVPGPRRATAFRVALQAMSVQDAHLMLQQSAIGPRQTRWLIQGSGIAGDPAYVPWLIARMGSPETARLAAEALATITGIDLYQGYEAPRPEGYEAGATEAPEDPNVDMDPDDNLPWPDVPRIREWWDANGSRFRLGQRYLMGAPVTREHCIEVLKSGYQRQRILAAHYLCLLEPGTPLFNTSAPAWRQQRLLAAIK
jgi:uncharacterized protein (TIGR02270 family)